MDEYLSEREQVDRIRQWWKDNGAWIIVGVGVGVLSLASWNWWQGYQMKRAEQASAIYAELAEAVVEERMDDVRNGVERLAAGHGSSPYLQHGRLVLAAVLVREGDLEAAIRELEQVLADARDPQLALVARLRLARLLVAKGDEERALSVVREGDAGAFSPAFLEVEGDALAAGGDPEGARDAYRRALEDAATLGPVIDQELVQLKLEALAPGAGAGSDAS